jgi:hypothetical protein
VAPGPRGRGAGSHRQCSGDGVGAGDPTALVKANRKIERLEAELAKTRMALDIMGKTHALLEILAESADPDTKSKH